MRNAGAWSTAGPFVASSVVPLLAVFPAILNNWRPWEIVGLVAALAPAGAAAAWAWAWQTVKVRSLELAALAGLSSDELAAQMLGESLSRCGARLTHQHAKAIWEVFATTSGEAKRAMALAVAGVVAESEEYEFDTTIAADKVRAVAVGFRDPSAPVPALSSDEEVARAFGEAVGQCHHLDAKATGELVDVFAALPGEAKRVFVNALTGYTAVADLQFDAGTGEKLLALARSFSAQTREAGTASPNLALAVTS